MSLVVGEDQQQVASWGLDLDPQPADYILQVHNGNSDGLVDGVVTVVEDVLGLEAASKSATTPGPGRVDRLRILLDGKAVLETGQLLRSTDLLRVPVQAGGPTTLSVEAEGPAGSFIEVRLLGLEAIESSDDSEPDPDGPHRVPPGKIAVSKIVTLQAIDSPDPASPNDDGAKDTTVFDALFAVTATDGLASIPHGKSNRFEFFVRWRSIIGQEGQVLRVLSIDESVVPPFETVELEVNGETRPYILVRSNQDFDGRDLAGTVIPDGQHPYTIEAEFYRRKIEPVHGSTLRLDGKTVDRGSGRGRPAKPRDDPDDGSSDRREDRERGRPSNQGTAGRGEDPPGKGRPEDDDEDPPGRGRNDNDRQDPPGKAGKDRPQKDRKPSKRGVLKLIGVARPVTGSLTIDTRPPEVDIVSPAPEGVFLRDARPGFEITYSDPAPSGGLPVETLQVLLDDVDVTASFTVGADRATLQPTEGLPEGAHELRISLRDAASNLTTVTRSFFIDSRDPVVEIATPAADAFLNQPRPLVEIAYQDPAPSSGLALESFVARLDNIDVSGQFTVGDFQATFRPADPLSDGRHSIEARISDGAGTSATLRVSSSSTRWGRCC